MSTDCGTPVIVPPGGRLLARGLGFTEGPVVETDEHVLVASINRGHVYRLSLVSRGAELVVDAGGGPNGLALGHDGEVWIAQNGATVMESRSVVRAKPSLQRWLDGRLETVVESGVDSPSDCVFGPDGRFWFTDPPDHSLDGTPAPGRLCAFDPASGSLQTALSGLLFPNGLAFGPDGSQVYVAETTPARVRRYSVRGEHVAPDGWEIVLPRGKPDGIALDAEGWLWVAGSTGDNVLAFDQKGRMRIEIDLGRGVMATSVCFAGPGLATLVVTVAKGGTVLGLPAPHPGLPLPIWREDR